jgi:hypothetical protein
MKKKIVEPLPELSPSRSSAGDGAINPADIDSHERLLAKAFTATEEAVGKTAIFEPFIYKMHYFTKTGSGQT